MGSQRRGPILRCFLRSIHQHVGSSPRCLEKNGITGLKVRFYLCEKRPEAVDRLRKYAAERSQFEIHVFEGKFEDNLDAIAAKIPNGFTFTFIDPTGWDIRSDLVFKFLKDRNGEFLLNFMADHINRHTEYSKVVESFGALP